MNRRTLLTRLSAGMLWLGISGCARGVLNRPHPGSGDRVALTTPLKEQLAGLADPHFRDYSSGRSVGALHARMVYKGVISARRGIHHEQLALLARREPLVIYKGFYYTQTELELYALAYLETGPE